jgi:hypothetical protein
MFNANLVEKACDELKAVTLIILDFTFSDYTDNASVSGRVDLHMKR